MKKKSYPITIVAVAVVWGLSLILSAAYLIGVRTQSQPILLDSLRICALLITPSLYITSWYFAVRIMSTRQEFIQFGAWSYGCIHFVIGYFVFYSQFKGVFLVAIGIGGIALGSWVGSNLYGTGNASKSITLGIYHFLAAFLFVHSLGMSSPLLIVPFILVNPNLYELPNYPFTLLSAINIVGVGILSTFVVTKYLISKIDRMRDVQYIHLFRLYPIGVFAAIAEVFAWTIGQVSVPLGVLCGVIVGTVLWLRFYPKPVDKKKKKHEEV